MSVTKNANRTGTRDVFETPEHATLALLTHPEIAAVVAAASARIVEHAAGGGAILRVLRAAGVAKERLVAVEIDESRRAALDDLAATVLCPQDTLAILSGDFQGDCDLAVTNPPYRTFDGADGVAAFARAGLRFVRPGGLVVLFARHDWVVPLDRDEILAEVGYPDIAACVRRASFIRLAQCKLCGGRWTHEASGPNKIEHAATMERPGARTDLAKIAACEKVGALLPAPQSSDTNAYCWLIWRRSEIRTEGRHMRLRAPRDA